MGPSSPARPDLLILESHPVQYHAPVYRELAAQCPGRILVVYGSNCSVRGHADPGFSRTITWDVPLMDGYPSEVLHADRAKGMGGFHSLSGAGVPTLLRRVRPRAVLFVQLAYEFEWAAFLFCLIRGIPMWLRTETQDEAFVRGRAKALLRAAAYRLIYPFFERFFCIGELNRRHYLAHGVPAWKLAEARYGVPDRLAGLSNTEKQQRRDAVRARLGIKPDVGLIAFFGKLIPKKDPAILLAAWQQLLPTMRERTQVLYVGAGELNETLQRQASAIGAPVSFAGFINQSEISDYYLAADVLVLPSRRRGETWGLVVNEALLAGCGVVVSEAVGCAVEFSALPRVVITPVGDATAVAAALDRLLALPRDFGWARQALEPYSITGAAAGIAAMLDAEIAP